MYNPRQTLMALGLCLLLMSLAGAWTYRISAPAGYSKAYTVITRNGHEVRWLTMPVHYSVCAAGTADVKSDGDDGYGAPLTAQQAVINAFDTWANASGTGLTVAYDGPGPCDTISARNQNSVFWVAKGWKKLPFNPPAMALAVTITTFYPARGEMVSGIIHFNNEYFHWANVNTKEEVAGQGGAKVDIQSVATHEIGHVLGMDHSSESPNEKDPTLRQAAMYYASHAGSTSQRVLNGDDLAGLRHLYPAKVVDQEPSVDGISPAGGLGGAEGGEVEVTVSGSNFAGNAHAILSRDKTDLQGQLLENSGEQLKVLFNLRGADPGDYDLVLSNSPEKVTRKEGIFKVVADESQLSALQSSSGGGGCGLVGDGGGRAVAASLAAVLILLLCRRPRRPAWAYLKLRRRG